MSHIEGQFVENLRLDLPLKKQDVIDSPRPRRLKFQARMVVRKRMRGSSEPSGRSPQGYCKSDSGCSCVQRKCHARTQGASAMQQKKSGPLRLRINPQLILIA